MNCLQGYEVEFQQAATYTNGGTLLTPLPFFHIFGMVVCMTAPLQLGMKVIFTPGFEMHQFLKLIQEHRVDRAIAVPPIILALYKSPVVSQYDTSSLKAIMSGAAPLGKEVQEGCAKRLGCIVKQGWGMTELSPVCCEAGG
jgi:acyl-CoA synthetase (AMP-forming)/AMP-acid ligase II